MRFDLAALLAAVRSLLDDPRAPLLPTGDLALDRALAALATTQLQGPTLPYWMLTRQDELEGRLSHR